MTRFALLTAKSDARSYIQDAHACGNFLFFNWAIDQIGQIGIENQAQD
jgi:hypothetical protein